MRLHGFWRSTATWRVRIALAHKNIAYDYTPVHLTRGGGEQHAPEFQALNPMRHVPVLTLEHQGRTHHVSESLAILELLEELIPDPALLPSDPLARARVRQLALLVVSGIQPLQNTKVQKWVKEQMHADAQAFAGHWIALGLDALEASAREGAGRFCVGDAVTFADVCLVPQLFMARRMGVEVGKYQTLLAIEARCAELPAFRTAHAENQPDAEPARPAQG